ncbi:MAG: MerR family DNA-binding protein [Chloroflexota bacterium]|nr:MerR family DNA-binding protein [Chloroflexota bacterium]
MQVEMLQERRLTIGEAACAAQVSAKAVRLWEEGGLLPTLRRTEAGYQMFTSTDLAALRFIRQAKAIGLNLAEIKDILDLRNAGTVPCGRVNQLIIAHIAEIDRTLAELQQLRQALVAAQNTARLSSQNGTDATLCHIIETKDAE